MKDIDKYLLEDPSKYINDLDNDSNYDIVEYSPPGRDKSRGNKITLKIFKKEDKDIIIYSYEDYN
ncbi:MAG: hypothetical protein U5K53_05525 [Halanaerobiales bacterium]|nr:hypothetical protein [Halanaerobiales bacterium]